jgi:hypothetical protein
MMAAVSNMQASHDIQTAAALGYYFFNPAGLIIMAVGMAAGYRTANGGVTG